MCDIDAILSSGCDEPYGERGEERDETREVVAEIKGQRRRVTVFRKAGKFVPPLSELSFEGRSLSKRAVKLKSGNARPFGASAKVETRVKIEWGGEENKVSGGVSFEASDDNGNYAKVEIEQKNDGTGSAEIVAGHTEK